MLIFSLVIGLVLGLIAGGHITNLASVRLRLVQLLFLRLALRYTTQFAIENGNARALPEMLMCVRADPGCSNR